MCGIAGVVSNNRGAVELTSVVARMNGAQLHRGPDAQGVQYSSNCKTALGHTRLKIIDLTENGAQPMSSLDGAVTISFNGEVYNFEELRDELTKCGYAFRGHSDTEVILNAFHKWGDECFAKLNGMFALAVADNRTGYIYLVRDRLGIKPLHFAFSAGELFFASEIKALLASKMVSAEPALDALPEFLYFGNSLGTRTFYAKISRLLPGSILKFKCGEPEYRITQYWVPRRIATTQDSLAESTERVRALLSQAVGRQLTADVPVGVFLSGGIDSSAIVALASRQYQGRLRTYSVGFDYAIQQNELPQARFVAEQFGTEHHELHVSGSDLAEVVERVSDAHDAPFADPADIPLYQLCRALDGETRVILQGDGGDEIFGGYRRYEYLASSGIAARSLRTFSPLLARMFSLSGGRFYGAKRFFGALATQEQSLRLALLLTVEEASHSPLRLLNPVLANEVKTIDPFERYRKIVTQDHDGDDLEAMLLTDMQILLPDIFLQKVDRATMLSSTEVRVPFLDFELVDYMLTVPARYKVAFGQKKKLLRAALHGVVPERILNAPKKGFGVPISRWLRGPLLDFFMGVVVGSLDNRDLFDYQAINNLVAEHRAGLRDHGQLLWKLLQLALWRRRSRQAGDSFQLRGSVVKSPSVDVGMIDVRAIK